MAGCVPESPAARTSVLDIITVLSVGDFRQSYVGDRPGTLQADPGRPDFFLPAGA
jgi:hypothetical protein